MVVRRKIIGGVVNSDSARLPKGVPFGETCCPYLNGLMFMAPELLQNLVPRKNEAQFGATRVAKTRMEVLSHSVNEETATEAT